MKRHEDGKFGVIYVLRMGNYYKIGKSSLNFTRLGEYTKLPEPVEYICVGVVLNALVFEDELHEMFKIKRIRGEWFNLDNQELEHLIEYIDSYSIFRLDRRGVIEYDNYKMTEYKLLLLAKAIYRFGSKKYKYDENYVKTILRQRESLISKFKKYDSFIPNKATFIFNTKDGTITNLV